VRVTEGQILFPMLYMQQVEGVRPDIRIEAPKHVFRPTAPEGGAFYYASQDAAPVGTPLAPQGILFRRISGAPPWKEGWDHLSVRSPPPAALGPMEREVLFGFHLRYAANLAAAGRAERAREELDRARPLAVDAEEGMAHLARAYHQAGLPREALALFQSVAAADPEDWRSRLLIGAISRELGEQAAAENAFREVCRLAPHRPEGHFYLALLLAWRGDREGAREAAAKGLSLAPDHPLAGEVRAALGPGLSR